MTIRQKKEALDNGIMTLKCIAIMLALCLVAEGHVIIPLLIAIKETAELVLFCRRLLLEGRYHVLHNQRNGKSARD